MKTPLKLLKLQVIGGAEDKVHGREILQTFFFARAGDDAHSYYSSASREPAIIGSRYLQILKTWVPSRLICWTFENAD